MPDPCVSPDVRQWLTAAGLAVKWSYGIDEVAALVNVMHPAIRPNPLEITLEARRCFAASDLLIVPTYRVDEVARFLRVGHRVIFKMFERGELDRLRTRRDGKRITPTRIPISSLLSLLD